MDPLPLNELSSDEEHVILRKGTEHRSSVSKTRVISHKGQQAGDLSADLVQGKSQQQVVGVGEVGLDSGKYIGGNKPGGPGDKFHQGTDLAGCSTLRVHDRISHISDVVNDANTHFHARKPFLHKYRPESINDPLSSIKAREKTKLRLPRLFREPGRMRT